MGTRKKETPVEVVDYNAYQEFIYCPYCYHKHNQIPGWENWGRVFHVICYKCSKVFMARIITLVVHDEDDKVWLGTGFDTERDDKHPFNQDFGEAELKCAFWQKHSFSPTGREYNNDPPIQYIRHPLVDLIDKLFWR
jgi:hypothetical protein